MSNLEPIYVVGYPRSGNTWLSRILGEVLDSPVEGYKGALPLATEGQNRNGKYVIRQLHLKPVEHDVEDGITADEISVGAWSGDKIIVITRDPRDVCVSAMYYWDIPNIDAAIDAVGLGVSPLKKMGAWSAFVNMWRETDIEAVYTLYENICWHGRFEIKSILYSLGIPFSQDDIDNALKNQEINTKRKQVSIDGDSRPYGKTIQTKHLRKGIVGDWRNHFTKQSGEKSQEYFGEEMLRLGYTSSPLWYLEEMQ